MPGFRITNLNTVKKLKNYDDSRCKKDTIIYNEWNISRNTLNKFMKDKLFLETTQYIIVLEGVIYNSIDLINKYNVLNFSEAIQCLLNSNKHDFFKHLDGSFSGAVFFKDENKWIIYTGPLGEKAIFYYYDKGKFIAGSQLNYITDILKELNIHRDIDIDALNQFMGYGFYLDDSTCLKNVKRLYPGSYVELTQQDINISSYKKIDYQQTLQLSNDSYITKLQEKFECAVEKVIKKNAEYNYSNLVDISGGADSRMISYTVKKLEAKNIILDCYGQSGCLDARIAEQVANDLDYQYIFRSLDNADCMKHIDENILMNNGATMYYGITGGKSMLEMFPETLIGLEFTGLLGDMYDGSMVITYPDGNIDRNYARFRCSQTLEYKKDFIFPEKEENRFEHFKNEYFWFYTRGMLFGMTSYFIRQNFVEVATPFGDPDFLEVYLNIPWEQRVKGNLLKKWMIKSYPSAAQIPYAATQINIKKELTILGLLEKKVKLFSRVLKSKIGKTMPQGMNDISYWYNTNTSFREYVNTYYSENVMRCEQFPDINRNVKKLYSSGSVIDKLIAVSVLSIIKNYIDIY